MVARPDPTAQPAVPRQCHGRPRERNSTQRRRAAETQSHPPRPMLDSGSTHRACPPTRMPDTVLGRSLCRVHQSPGHGADQVKQPECGVCPAGVFGSVRVSDSDSDRYRYSVRKTAADTAAGTRPASGSFKELGSRWWDGLCQGSQDDRPSVGKLGSHHALYAPCPQSCHFELARAPGGPQNAKRQILLDRAERRFKVSS